MRIFFIFELYNKHKRARYISEPVANYYVVSNSLSSDKGRGAGWHWSLLGEIFETNILKKRGIFVVRCQWSNFFDQA